MRPSTWSVRAALAALFSFELLFVLFLFAGRIKGSPYFAWIPFDMTGLFFALSVIAGAFIVLTKKINRRGLVITGVMAAFVSWLVVSLVWSPGVIYAHQKVVSGGVLGFWACAGAAVIVAADRARVRRLLTLLVLLALWFAIEGVIAYAIAEQRWYLELSGTHYGGLGNTVGYGAVILIATLISIHRFDAFNCGTMAVVALFLFVILVAGSRLPLLALGGILVIAAVIGFRLAPGGIAFQRFQRAAWGILLVCLVSIGVATMSGEFFTLHRIREMLNLLDPSAAARQRAMGDAVRFWAGAPIVGNGVGSFPILENWVTDARRYPHNIILEILSDLGLIGLFLFSLFVLSAVRYVKLHCLREDPLFRCIFLLTIFAFSAAMGAGDLGDNRLLYTMLGLLAMPAGRSQRSPSGRGPSGLAP